jgi:hypothetical protein
MPSLEEIVHKWHADQPHPLAPSVKVGDYATAARMATTLKFGQGHATPQEVGNFWREFQSMNETLTAQNKLSISPDEFSHLAQQVARSSFTYHGRPPSMHEIARLRDSHPKDINDFYYHLPDEHYPSVPAGEMVKALQSARPWAEMINGSAPTKLDGAYLYHSGHLPQDYYQARAKYDGNQDRAGSYPGAAGPDTAGGQQADQRVDDPRLASGNAAAGRSDGLSQR